jgi:hypothetical protein
MLLELHTLSTRCPRLDCVVDGGEQVTKSVRLRLNENQYSVWSEISEGPLATWIREVVCKAIGREDLLVESDSTRAGRTLQAARTSRGPMMPTPDKKGIE